MSKSYNVCKVEEESILPILFKNSDRITNFSVFKYYSGCKFVKPAV